LYHLKWNNAAERQLCQWCCYKHTMAGVTLALMAGVLLVVVVLASLIPARTSARIDPIVALRAE
jgi:hypothetical protein